MYKRILVAVDGSDTSQLALQEAVNLTKESGGQLRIVHVVDEVTFDLYQEVVDPGEIQKAITKSGEVILSKAQIAVRAAGVKAETRLLEIEKLGRRVPDMIAQEADAWPADLIVIGTHGRHGFNHLLMGSVAEGVVRSATKPVLLIRGK
ncbi:MAG: universal stress protein [Sulfuricaulis sp.]|uniref:universal stress protein n=1 Tax=Sulfuricaulis sp. TaxID=2003553 RepID=UPI003C6A4229